MLKLSTVVGTTQRIPVKTRNLTCSNGVVVGTLNMIFKVVTTMRTHILVFRNITRVTSYGGHTTSISRSLIP